MIDFTHCKKKNKGYSGANGKKICVEYNNELYMLKFPSLPSINKDMSYANSCISEYLGCKIFKEIGIPVQEVILGIYTTNAGKEKIVCACKDLGIIQDFASLKNQIIDSERNGYGTELNDILLTFDEQTIIDSELLKERFWDMFIVDALIGNWDRHNGNWGFLYDVATDNIELSPVYDCGSSLYPQADMQMMNDILKNPNLINHRVYNIPLSAIKQNDKKINYFNFISSLENQDCNNALQKIVPCIDLECINQIIDDIPFISELQKDFYKLMLKERKEKILDFSYQKLQDKISEYSIDDIEYEL